MCPRLRPRASFPQWYGRLSSAFCAWRRRGRWCDVTLLCRGGVPVRAHRIVLQRAGHYLRRIMAVEQPDAEADADAPPSGQLIATLADFEASDVECFVESLYTGCLPDEDGPYRACRALCKFFQLAIPDEWAVASPGPAAGARPAPSQGDLILHEAMAAAGAGAGAAEKSPLPADSDQYPPSVAVACSSQLGEDELRFEETTQGDYVLLQHDRKDGDAASMSDEEKAGPITNSSTSRVESSDAEEKRLRAEKIRLISEAQHKLCGRCGQRALEHRVPVEDHIHVGSGQELKQNMFIYRCCLDACVGRVFRNARNFNLHAAKHDSGHVSCANGDAADPPGDTPTQRPCPLCFKTRLDHKNRDEEALLRSTKRKGSWYKCCHCSASRLSAKKFFHHVLNHVTKQHQCSVCGKGYSYAHLLEQHHYKEHGEGRERDLIKCSEAPNCSFETRYKQTMVSHQQEKHQGLKRPHRQGSGAGAGGDDPAQQTVSCPTCKKELKRWYYQQYHRKTCAAGSVIYQCDICQQEGFVNSTTLQNHVRSKHSDERPFACEYCPAKYATAMSLSSHRARKHQVNKAGEFVPKKLYPCDLCGKLLTSRTKLLQHVKVIHEHARDFACGFCDKRFTSRSNQRIHEGSAHTGVLPYKCSECDKSFTRKNMLAAHVEQLHEREREREREQERERQAAAGPNSPPAGAADADAMALDELHMPVGEDAEEEAAVAEQYVGPPADAGPPNAFFMVEEVESAATSGDAIGVNDIILR